MIEVEYDLETAVLRPSPNSLERFFDILPIADSNLVRWHTAYTPCVHATALGRLLGMPHLYLKDETVLPTGTTKDRMARVAAAYLWESGVRRFCTSSTGNSSTAYAHAIAQFPDMSMVLFTAEDFGARVDYGTGTQVTPFVLRDATFVDAFNCAAQFAADFGLVSERGFFNPGRREGLKLAFLEATDQVPGPIDWYVQAVSSAMGVYGTYKGAREMTSMGRIERPPRLLCVQQDTCAPMVRAFEEGSETIKPHHVVHRPTGIAQAILRGDPTRAYPYVRAIVAQSGGTFTSVSEAQIREARTMIEEYENLSPCFSASAAFAGLTRLVRENRFPVTDTVVVNLTGSDRPVRPVADTVRFLVKHGDRWVAEDPATDLRQLLGSGPSVVGH
jgi:threonine synthase